MAYLNSLIDHPEQIDYHILEQLKAPKTLVYWLRVGQLENKIPYVIECMEYGQYSESWEAFEQGFDFSLSF
jgi:hypothetical protein